MHRACRATGRGRSEASSSPLRRAFSCRLPVQSIMDDMNFGITLSNRAVPLGLCNVRDLLALADAIEACPALDSVWCGDALFVNRRLDALTLLAAVAGRTERVLLGPACMGSFALRNPLVFAYEWASLDVLSNGRTRLVACAGGGSSALWQAEGEALGIAAGERRRRRSEEHTSELQSRLHLVCRLLLEK